MYLLFNLAFLICFIPENSINFRSYSHFILASFLSYSIYQVYLKHASMATTVNLGLPAMVSMCPLQHSVASKIGGRDVMFK